MTEIAPSPQLLINMATFLITLTPQSLPTFFFTRKQLTHIRLVLIPSTTNGESLTMPSGASYVFQVMGVLTQRRPKCHPKLIRSITGISLIITLHRLTGKGAVQEVLGTKYLPISGDFFSGEFCLSLPTKTESCQLTVEAILIDDQRKRWRLGKEAGAAASMNIRLENMIGAGNVGGSQKSLDFNKPLPVQTEGVIKTMFS